MVKITPVKNPSTIGATVDYARDRAINPNYDKDKVKAVKKIGRKARIKFVKNPTTEKSYLKKPKAKVPSVSAKKLISQGLGGYRLVRKGKTGYFNDEYEKEIKWLS